MSLACRVVLAASLPLVPTALTAQQCLGGASFADRRAQINADAGFSSGARSFSGGISVGSRAPFASVGFGTAYDDDVGDEATIFSAMAGFALPSQPKPRTQFCPFVSALVITGVELEGGLHLSSQTFAFGIGVGRLRTVAPWLEIVPTAVGTVATQTTSIQFGTDGATGAENTLHWNVSLGAGFVLRKLITIRPSTSMSIADRHTTMSYGLHASLGFGGGVRVRPPPGEGEGSLTTVWVNTRARVYYCPGSNSYGATPRGTFMTERQALANGARPASGKRCE